MFAQVKLEIAGKFDEFYNKLGSQDDFEFRVKTAIEALEHVLPLEYIQCECKDSQLSYSLRKKADELFFDYRGSTKGLLLVLETYSKSVAFAENNSRALSLAYANRSAILCNLQKYKECVQDIDKALNLNYPDNLKANLLRRKTKCLKILEQPEAEKVCEQARQGLKSTKLLDEHNFNSKELIQNVGEVSEFSDAQNKIVSIFNRHLNWSKKIPCASDAINIQYHKNYGRHIIATRDINVGEILAVEKPYAMLLKPECLYTHCSQCFKRAWNSIPCPKCVHAMYCSEKCKNEAWEQYHDIECFVKGYFFSLNMNDLAPFSLKLAVLAIREAGGIDKLKRKLQKLDECTDPLARCFSENGIYRSDTYQALYCFETHMKSRLLKDFSSVTINAAVIVYFVYTVTTFFGENLDNSFKAFLENEDVIFLARLIGHHYMSLQMNNHEITEHNDDGIGIGLGAAVFPFCALFNHNCDPNATRVPVVREDGDIQQIIIAQYPIKKGSQVYDDYGFDFSMMSLSDRQTACQNYHFACICRACKDDWPLLKDLPNVLSVTASEDKKAELIKVIKNIASYEKIIFKGELKNMDPRREEVLTKLAKSVTILYEHSSEPTKELFRAVSFFRQAFILTHGHRIHL